MHTPTNRLSLLKVSVTIAGPVSASVNYMSFPSAGHKMGMANCHSEAQHHRRELHCDLHDHQEPFLVLCPHIQMLIDGGVAFSHEISSTPWSNR